MGGATTGDMNTATVDEDEEYVPSNDETDSDSEYIETCMGEGTGKPKRKASNQREATSRASAKKAKKKQQLPEKRYLFFLPRIFASFF